MNYETIKKINEIAPDAMLSISVKDIIAIVNESKTYEEVGEADGYVDLGLPSGTLWAKCNVGASSPEECGNYYAWGETETKVKYIIKNSVARIGLLNLQKQGYIDGSGNLTPSHDAATANWGGEWRIPTRQEMQELVNYCEWEWTQVNGVYGSRVIGPNGNYIFLPAAGYRYGSSLNGEGDNGSYWSSSPSGCYSTDSLYFSSDGEYVRYSNRSHGHAVRPVRSKNK